MKEEDAEELMEAALLTRQAELKKKYGESFYTSLDWLRLKQQTITRYGYKCQLCGASSGVFCVSHIKPRVKYPELALDPENVQVMCKDCNIGKHLNKDETDFRNM